MLSDILLLANQHPYAPLQHLTSLFLTFRLLRLDVLLLCHVIIILAFFTCYSNHLILSIKVTKKKRFIALFTFLSLIYLLLTFFTGFRSCSSFIFCSWIIKFSFRNVHQMPEQAVYFSYQQISLSIHLSLRSAFYIYIYKHTHAFHIIFREYDFTEKNNQ